MDIGVCKERKREMKVESKETITIEEFKSLASLSSDKKSTLGRYIIDREAHKKRCESLEVGDEVFFVSITMAKIVE